MLCILVPQPLDRPYTVARYYAHDRPWQTSTRQRFLVNILTSNPMRTARLHPRLDLRGWTFSCARCNVSAEVPISQWARLRRTMSQRHAQLTGNAIEDRPGRLLGVHVLVRVEMGRFSEDRLCDAVFPRRVVTRQACAWTRPEKSASNSCSVPGAAFAPWSNVMRTASSRVRSSSLEKRAPSSRDPRWRDQRRHAHHNEEPTVARFDAPNEPNLAIGGATWSLLC